MRIMGILRFLKFRDRLAAHTAGSTFPLHCSSAFAKLDHPLLARALVAALAAGSPATLLAAPDTDCELPLVAPLTLRALESRVAECSRDVRATLLAVDAARADAAVASQGLNPTLALGASNVNPSVGVGAGSLREKTFDSSLRLEQVFERGGKPTLRQAQANALLRASLADHAEQLRQQRLTARTAFFDLAASQERLRLQREFSAIAADSAQATQRRFEAGEVSRSELDRFRLDGARALNDLRQAQMDLQRARVDLGRAIGAETSTATLAVEGDGVLADSRGGDWKFRADVVAARDRVEAAEAARDLGRSISTRDVTVGVQADHWPTSPTNMQGTGISYSVGISIPLHARHSNQGEAARALADLESARASLQRANVRAAADVLAAEDELASARERLARVDNEVLPAARRVAESAEFAYARGATGILDLLDARRSLRAVELDAVGARADMAKAWARREAANEFFREEAP
jgi:cobalt-zinc-cadmium efflux system outer membrane protein